MKGKSAPLWVRIVFVLLLLLISIHKGSFQSGERSLLEPIALIGILFFGEILVLFKKIKEIISD